jgi:hypothetical protein
MNDKKPIKKEPNRKIPAKKSEKLENTHCITWKRLAQPTKELVERVTNALNDI